MCHCWADGTSSVWCPSVLTVTEKAPLEPAPASNGSTRQGWPTPAAVNTASVAGLVGLPYGAAYVASKHGVVGLIKIAALEYAKQGFRVNCVCPGYIQTPMTAAGMQDPARLALMLASEPVGRMGRPEAIAEAVVWLCADAASFVIGHTMTVDGGFVAP